ncbi:MAG: hypothetical protein U9R16_03955, partial [Campylobacterota bacterium]|nr:hypothetical protein [Campylobacterota bacterium]
MRLTLLTEPKYYNQCTEEMDDTFFLKSFSGANYEKISYQGSYTQVFQNVTGIDTIEDLNELLKYGQEVYGCIIQGEPIKNDNRQKRRLIHAKENEKDGQATIKINSKIGIFIVDVDDKPNPFCCITDESKHIDYIYQELAKIDTSFIETSSIFQFSSSAGIKEGSCSHIFYILDTERSSEEMEAIFTRFNKISMDNDMNIGFDGSVNRLTQPIYLADPLFINGAVNPIEQRYFKRLEKNERLSFNEELWKPKPKIKRAELITIDDELKNNINNNDLQKAIERFNSFSESYKGMGGFVGYLKNMRYEKDTVESAWEHFYSGDNFTLVRPTTANNHTYNKFNECWNQITYTVNKIKYFQNIYNTVILATSNTFNSTYCILPKMDKDNLIKLSSLVDDDKEVILLISDKASECFVKFLFDFKRDNFLLNWYISISYKDKALSKEKIIKNKFRLFKE